MALHGLGCVWVLVSMRRAHRRFGKATLKLHLESLGMSERSQVSEERHGFLSDSPKFPTYDL